MILIIEAAPSDSPTYVSSLTTPAPPNPPPQTSLLHTLAGKNDKSKVRACPGGWESVVEGSIHGLSTTFPLPA